MSQLGCLSYGYMGDISTLLLTGLHSLIHNNMTEHPDTINVLERMNIYQEVVLSVLYRVLPIKVITSTVSSTGPYP